MAQRKKPKMHRKIKGASGRGKSKFLQEIAESATRRGMRVGIIDPSKRKAKRKPKARRKRRR